MTGVDNDLWSGPEASYRRVRCHGGTLEVTLGSDPATFNQQEQTVLATMRTGTRSRRSRSARGRRSSSGSRSGRRTTSARSTSRLADEVPGGGDLRELGVRFLAFDYKRP